MPAVSKPAFTPLYAQIKDSILSRIVAGEWSPGSFLPSEMALAEEYGVSQGTLRKALNELTLEKRLVRYQGKGTAVAVLDADSSLFPFFMLYDAAGRRVYPCPAPETFAAARRRMTRRRRWIWNREARSSGFTASACWTISRSSTNRLCCRRSVFRASA